MKLKTSILLIIALLIVLPFIIGLNKIFFGFEYEDAFINSFVGSQDNPFYYSENYRTHGCFRLINNECVENQSFTGHYLTYALYLNILHQFFETSPYFLHRMGNAILYCLTLLLSILILRHKIQGQIFFNLLCFFLILSTSLPSIYVLNSSLIENLSVSVNIILIILVYYESLNRKIINKVLVILLLSISIIIKRENLILLPILFFVISPKDLRKKEIYLSLILLVLFQILINPFYTEFLEAESLGKSTFSIEFLQFQFPTYLNTFLVYDGYLSFTIILITLMKPTLKAFYFLLLFFVFILLYSFHYRSQYAVINESISLFETYRYLTNTTPLLLGYMLFSKFRKSSIIKLILPLLFTMMYLNSLNKMENYINEEIRNYHVINERIEDSIQPNEDVLVIDNFILVSLLNLKHKKDVDVIQYEEKTFSNLKYNNYSKIYFINRFQLIDTNLVSKKYFDLIKVPYFSIANNDVYEVQAKSTSK